MKSNFVEAGRSIGETLLPTITDISEVATSAAQGLANISEGTQKLVVGSGAAVVAAGALAKGTAGTLKTIGGIVEGVGKLKAAAAGTGALASIVSVAGPVALGIAGITTAVIAGTAAYKKYEYEQTHFADGAEEAVQVLAEQKSALDEVNNYTWEFKELQVQLNSDGISDEDKSQIVSRMQEIAEWFDKNYDVELKVESESVETATENIEKLDRTLKSTKIETEIQGNNTLSELIDNLEEFQNAPVNRDEATNQAEKWEAVADKMLEAKLKASEFGEQVRLIKSDTTKTTGEQLAAIDKVKAEYQDMLADLFGEGTNDYNGFLSSFSHIDVDNPFETKYKEASEQVIQFTADAELAQEQFDKYQQSARDYISQQNEMLTYDIGDGKDYSERLKKIGYAAQMAELPLGEVAAQTAALQNGFETFSAAAEAGGDALNNTITNAMQNMLSWGAEIEQVTQSGALMKNGFADLQGAINANALDAVIKDFISTGQSMGLTTEQIVSNAALIKNGFSDLESALEKGDIDGVIQDMVKLGETMGMTVDDVNNLAHSLGLIPDTKKLNLPPRVIMRL
ncbi:MAG: hypothetical protein LIO53_02200 [Oscillospiraceae bacterium]|nr:hypothetical protein [Oscillospiraceae bacterium]